MNANRALTQLESLLRARHALVYLVSREEGRWTRLLAQLARRAGVPLVTWTAVRGAEPPLAGAEAGTDPTALLGSIGAQETRALYVLCDFHVALRDPSVARRLRELEETLIERGSAVLVLAPFVELPRELEGIVSVVDLPLPDEAELRGLVGAALDRRGAEARPMASGSPEVERLARALVGLTERGAIRALTRGLAEHGTDVEALLRTLVDEKRRTLVGSVLLEPIDAEDALAEVGGLGALKEWLRRRAVGFGEAARARGLPPPRGMLLLGVQGCGKSLVARAVAREWAFPLVRLDLSAAVRQERVGSGEGLAAALQRTEQLAPVVLWVDELEKGFAEGEGSGDGAVARALGAFVTWMQEKRGAVFVAATANRVDRLPPEMLRKGRFDEIFFVDLPSHAERAAIARIHLEKRKLDPARVDVQAIARSSGRRSGAEIEQAILTACFDALADHREVTTSDVITALESSVPLALTMEREIEALRDWAERRARSATLETRLQDMIAETLAAE